MAIRRQPLQPTLAAEAAFFVAAEGAGGVELVVGVSPDDASAEFVDQLENLAAFVGPHAGAEAVGGVVGAFDGFFGGAEGEDAEDGAEDFFLRDAVTHGDVGKEAGGEPVAFGRERAGGLFEFATFGDAAGDEGADFVELGAGVDGADVGVFVEGVADAEGLEAVAEFADDLGIDAFLHEESRAGAADMALVEVDAVDDAFDGLVEGGVVEEDVGGFATEFEGEFGCLGRDALLRVRGVGDAWAARQRGPTSDHLRDGFADFGAAGEGDFVDAGMVDEGGTGRAGAGDDVDDAVGEAGFLEDFARGAAR